MTSGDPQSDRPAIEVRLLEDTCSGHARCNAIASWLFPVDEAGYSTLKPTTVPASRAAEAREAAVACPEDAIVVLELPVA
ncbi:MAG: ferredoxin [Actinobacteria bacterium]|nr:ferredoxin [Actinomycetota bacterium]